MTRASATPGERRSAEWIAARLRERGVADVELQTFAYQTSWALRQAPHFAAGALAAALGGRRGRLLAAAALGSFALDFSGRLQWLAALAPRGEGTNVVARIPAARGRRRTLVLVAHHDAARTGLMWSPALVRRNFRNARDRGVVDSFAALPSAALAIVAAGPRRARPLAGALLAVATALALDVARGETVPGASDNASGVAAVLSLCERFASEPLPGVEVIALFPGCEESGMGGMAHWLRGARERLDRDSTLVLGLDTLGAGEPVVATGEALPHTVVYRAEDLALADVGADIAGLERPRRLRLGAWTDPILAAQAGLPALSLLSLGPDGFGPYHVPEDVPERVDFGSVERCARLAEGIALAFAR